MNVMSSITTQGITDMLNQWKKVLTINEELTKKDHISVDIDDRM